MRYWFVCVIYSVLFVWSLYTVCSINFGYCLASYSHSQYIQVTAEWHFIWFASSGKQSSLEERKENVFLTRGLCVCVSGFGFLLTQLQRWQEESWGRHTALNCSYRNHSQRNLTRPAMSRCLGCHLAAEGSRLSSWITGWSSILSATTLFLDLSLF